MYTSFVHPDWPFSSPDAPAALAVMQKLLAQARASGIPVLHSRAQKSRNAAERGRWKARAMTYPIMDRPETYEIVPELAPLPTETVVVKTAPSALHGTNLLSMLIYHNIDTVIVTGTVTSGCVRATVVDAFSYGFRVIVPVEAVYDRSRTSHKVALWDIYTRYGDVLPADEVMDYMRRCKNGVFQDASGAPAGAAATQEVARR
jgi:nicotinamidase-related amidase